MTGRTCYHCKQWVAEGEAHDCWTTTEEALTEDLSEDLREAWERLREAAAAQGEQRIYASHHCIMFARRTAYFFVRPKRNYLELCLFLGHTVQAPQIRSVKRVSSTRLAHIVQVRHRDEVEAPLTGWIAEAYALQSAAPAPRRTPAGSGASSAGAPPASPARRRPAASKAAVRTAAGPRPAERKRVPRKPAERKRVPRKPADQGAGQKARPRPKPK